MSAVRKATISTLQSDAAAAISRGNAAKALALYRSAARLDTKNPMHGLRAGDCLVRLGRIDDAVVTYRLVAERFAEDGQYARAISVYRLVERLAPGDEAAARRLEEIRALREQKRPEPKPAEESAAEVAAMFPVIDLEVPVCDPDPEPVRVSTELCSLWEEELAAAAAPETPADTAALETTVRKLMSELRRVQIELDAIRARAASVEVVVSVC